MIPLYGGGFCAAYVQLLIFYYSVGAVLHLVVPAILPVQGIQKQERGSSDVSRDMVSSLGASAVASPLRVPLECVVEPGFPVTSGTHNPACLDNLTDRCVRLPLHTFVQLVLPTAAHSPTRGHPVT